MVTSPPPRSTNCVVRSKTAITIEATKRTVISDHTMRRRMTILGLVFPIDMEFSAGGGEMAKEDEEGLEEVTCELVLDVVLSRRIQAPVHSLTDFEPCYTKAEHRLIQGHNSNWEID